MTCTCLTEQEYMTAVGSSRSGHWKSGEGRWVYHAAAVDVARAVNPSAPGRVLEMGTMGVSIVHGSDTIDYAEKWNFKGFNPTFLHDVRKMPWPVADKAYDLLIALRVYHHLIPVQRECFAEAKRVARNLIIVTPESYGVQELKETSRGITREEFATWNDGVPPTQTIEFKKWIGNLYFWNESALG